jgi:hypothetical protein
MTDALVIDAEGLDRLSCNAKANPDTGKKTLKAKTVCEAGFRNMTYVRGLAPMLVGEPPALLGDDSAPNPSETALAALGSYVSVGLLANATHRGVTLTKIEPGSCRPLCACSSRPAATSRGWHSPSTGRSRL